MIFSGQVENRGDYINERLLREKFGVSRVTMRRVLARLQAENILLSIPYKGYVLGPAAKLMSKKTPARASRTQTQILWVKSPVSQSMREHTQDRNIFQSASAEGKKRGLEIELCRLSVRELCGSIRTGFKNRLYGIAVDWPDREVAEALFLEGVPAVIIEYLFEGLAMDSVLQDDQNGIEMAVARLWEAGHRNIGLIVWGQSALQPLRRRSAFMASLIRRGIVANENISLSSRFDAQGGREAAARLLDKKDPPSALILCHLEMGAGVFAELADRGLAPGRDVGIVSWGTPETQALWLAGTPWADFPLDLIGWDRSEMGATAVRILEARRNEPLMPPLRVELPTVLTVRKSVFPFKK
jgi:DNA-binding LacI/PurR family transcriptional regulator